MRIRLIHKKDLTVAQTALLEAAMRSADANEGESGPVRAWRNYQRYLYAFVDTTTGYPIAVAEASGRPTSSPGWWIAPEHRSKGYGYELVDLLAMHLKIDGVTAIGTILIQTPGGAYDDRSRKLEARLRTHFPDEDA